MCFFVFAILGTLLALLTFPVFLGWIIDRLYLRKLRLLSEKNSEVYWPYRREHRRITGRWPVDKS